MEIGAIVYSTQQGLGILAKQFFDHGLITRVLIKPHPHYKEMNWYPDNVKFSKSQCSQFFDGLDTLLVLENPFFPSIMAEVRQRGIKVVLVPMYEFSPPQFTDFADLVICPSLLDLQYFKERSVFLPIPVNVKWRQRTCAIDFVCNAGHGGAKDRNGVPELIEAMQYIKSPAKLLLRAQNDDSKERLVDQWPVLSKKNYPGRCSNITLYEGVEDYDKLWEFGDVFVFPEKFNGLSLPLQEACAAGMLVMAGNRFPMNTWLRNEPLIPVKYYREDALAVRFKSAVYSVKAIADTIDFWYGKDITEYSLYGKEWAEKHSWEVLKPKWLEYLCN